MSAPNDSLRSVLGLLPYPGRILAPGESDRELVRVLQRRLLACGCAAGDGPEAIDGVFGRATSAAVRLFQARYPDASGAALEVDGLVGPLTWAALFGGDAGPALRPGPFAAAALEIAATELGVLEQPPGSNRGPRVDEYLRAVDLGPGQAWCAAFVYWVFERAAQRLGRPNPLVRTGAVLRHWRSAGRRGTPRLLAVEATADPARLRPGMIFAIDSGGGHGHTGLVEDVRAGRLITLEGNTAVDGTREGTGVFRLARRPVASISLGFLDYDAESG